MNASDPVPSNVPPEDLLVSDEAKHYFRAIVQYGFQVFVQCVGIVTNIINIIVFFRSGLKDSITVTFFGLSISDLLHLLSYLTFRLILLSDFFFVIDSHIYPWGFSYPFSLYAIYFYDVSMYITVFAAVQKCCCVVFPFRFKNTFTPRRAFFVIVVIFVATLVVFLPVLTGLPFITKFYPSLNKTLVTVTILSYYREAEYYWQSVVKIGLTPVSQLIVIACLVIMSGRIRKSAKFRKGSNMGSEKKKEGGDVELSKKDIRALQAVLLVCVVFVVTSFPPTVAYLVQSVFPPFNSPQYLNLKHVVLNLIYFLGTINASVNILFYLRFNTNYKNILLEMCRLDKERKESTQKQEVCSVTQKQEA